MTQLLDKAFEAVRQAPPERQDAVARLMLDMVAQDYPDELSPEELAAVLEAEAQVARGEFIEGDAEELLAAAFRRDRS